MWKKRHIVRRTTLITAQEKQRPFPQGLGQVSELTYLNSLATAAKTTIQRSPAALLISAVKHLTIKTVKNETLQDQIVSQQENEQRLIKSSENNVVRPQQLLGKII